MISRYLNGLRALALGSLVACNGASANPDAALLDASVADIATSDSPDSNGVTRGPVTLMLDADPNGLWWDAASATLYIADNLNNRILSWRDGVGTQLVADLSPFPRPSGGRGLGQLVRTADGMFLVTRFGQGTTGDVAYLTANGTVGAVPNLDPTRQRAGITVANDGTIYDVYFGRTMSGHVGALDTLALDGHEVDLLTGLQKPLGVLAIGARLFLSDQDTNEILVLDRANPTAFTHYATLTSPDLLCEGPDSSLFAGSLTGVVYRVMSDGTVTTFVGGYETTRGVAYDSANRRLFISDHSSTNGPMNFLHIVPVD